MIGGKSVIHEATGLNIKNLNMHKNTKKKKSIP